MTNVEKVNQFLDEAKTFYFLTTDGDKPKGRPFGFHLLDGDKLYFGCGTFKNVFSQLTKNPHVEVLAVRGGEFMRYDGTVKIVENDALLEKSAPRYRKSWLCMIRTAGKWGCSIWKTVTPKFVECST